MSHVVAKQAARTAAILAAACILAVVMSPAYAWADDSLPVAGEDLGATNPVGAADTNMFRDDELNIWGVMRGPPELHFFPGAPTNDALTAWSFNYNAETVFTGLPQGWFFRAEPVWLPNGQTDYAWPLIAIASGRVSDPLHDQTVMVGTDNFPGKVDVVLRATSDPGTPLDAAQLTGVPYSNRTIGVDVAVGDLDRVVDENGYFHDEIVVVWGPQGTDCRTRMDVLDYDLTLIASGTMTGCTGRVAATIGDFNADGNLEFAAVTNDETTLRVQACSLVVDSPQQWHLACLPEYAIQNFEKFPSVDAAAGSVLGLGKEEIIVVTSPGAPGAQSAGLAVDWFRVTIVGLNLQTNYQKLELYQSTLSDYSPATGTADIPGVHEVRVATGLFRYDPAHGYDFGERQIVTAALGVRSGDQTVDVWFWNFPGPYDPPTVFAKAHTSASGKHTAKPSLAVGNFVGHGVSGNQTQPTMQVALTYLFATADNINDPSTVQKSAIWELSPPDSVSPTWTTALMWSSTFSQDYATWSYDPFIVAADYDGDSWRLGIPIHITISGAPSYNSLLEEPPKHVDYLPVDPDDLSKGFGMINISGYKTFYVALSKTESQSISTEKTDTTNRSFGGGADLSGDWQVNLGKSDNPKMRLDVNAEAKFNYSYEDSTKDVNSHYLSSSVSWTNSTDADDELDVSIQDTDIWKYPIIGFETGDTSNPMGYYEIAIPGKTYESQLAGKDVDWYAPLHVNNNILSYPQILTTQLTWMPSDVGPFRVPELDDEGNPIVDEDGNPVMREVTDLLAAQILYTWDGNHHSQHMEFDKTDKTSHQTEFMNTISDSVDIGAGLSSKVRLPVPGVPLSFSLEFKGDISFSHETSWGGETVGSTELSNATGVQFEIPAISGFSQLDRGYSFASAVYSSTNGGGLKVAHTIVGLISNPRDWWVKQYGRAPDPALNLPFLFKQNDPDSQHANLNWWELKTDENDPDDTRHEMRGFFMRNNYPNDVSGKYDLFSGNPVDGDIIQLCVRAYNFSLGQATGNFDADFYHYGWNQRTGREVDPQTGEEVYRPVWIGKASVASLDALSTYGGTTMREVCVPWDTTGLSVDNPDIGYRFVVKLDEADVVKNEIHELTDPQGNEAAGGNNSGHWPWVNAILVDSPMQASSAARGLPLVNGVLEDTSRDVNFWLSEGDLAIKGRTGFLEGEAIQVEAGETYRVRAHIVSETPYSGNVWVAFFEGKPMHGGKLVALELGRGLRRADNYVWGRWTPMTSGEHELRAYAFHRVSAANDEGATTSRPVTVMSASAGDDDGCALAARRGSRLSGSAPLVLVGVVCLAVRAFKRGARRGSVRRR